MNNQSSARFINVRPESEAELTKIAEKVLRRAEAFDVLPTPLDRLYEVANVTEHELPMASNDGLFERFSETTRGILQRALEKVRGMTDLRERAIYIPLGHSNPRLRFVRGHELAHNLIPWQKFRNTHLDTALDLTPNARYEFDHEANFMSGELNYQGRRFIHRARSYTASLAALDALAGQHETSVQATLWRYAEVQDERILVAMYYPNERTGEMKLWKCVASREFEKRFPDVTLPNPVDTDHPW